MGQIATAGRLLVVFLRHERVRAVLRAALHAAYGELIGHLKERQSRGRRTDIGL